MMTGTNPIQFAATRPLALFVLLAAVASGVTVALWLLPLGLLAYGAMVALGSRDPALRSAAARPTRPNLVSPTFRTQIEAIERTQQEIGRSAGQAGGALARLLLPVADQARDLVGDAYTLGQKGQLIEAYLVRTDQRQLQKEVDALTRQVTTTRDPSTADQLRATLAARQETLRNAQDLETYIARINAQLQNIGATLDNVLADTVRLRTADAASADATTSQVAGRLADLKSDMDAFQSVLDNAITHAGP